MFWAKWVAGGLLAFLLVWAGLAVIGAVVWQKRVSALEQRLVRAPLPEGGGSYDPGMLADLPAPVARYLSIVIDPGQPMLSEVELAHEGQLNLGVEAWRSFTSTQRVTVLRPGFLWNGKVRMVPGLPVRVIDAYIGGEGLLLPSLLGLAPLTHLEGAGEIAEGELLRWLAETPWYPTALLPGQGVEWRAIDAFSAEATVRDGAVTARLVFEFSADGLVSAVRAAARGRSEGGRMVPRPWLGRWSGYARQAGILVPTQGEVAWLLEEGERPYWRGRITGIRFRTKEAG